MRSIFAGLVVALCFVGVTRPAFAEGCLKGAAVGGVAGHVAGHHAVAGGAAGCAIGHHEAKKKEKAANAQGASAPK
ncbi:hypothetical protein [Paraburkholderia sp. J41]|uniref:hypothetical protein n=1 Tax=Paraburkholderia sp. J41 TaxID=2805433 RepID=UPI002AC32AD0|nr:hypothetical protein [Paraburkholderia sp. J41]